MDQQAIGHRAERTQELAQELVAVVGAQGAEVDALSLARVLNPLDTTGIEPGPHLAYRVFLNDLGVGDQDLEKATIKLAGFLRKPPS